MTIIGRNEYAEYININRKAAEHDQARKLLEEAGFQGTGGFVADVQLLLDDRAKKSQVIRELLRNSSIGDEDV